MNKVLNIVVAGLGTVGSATISLIEKNANLLFLRSGVKIKIIGIYAKNKNKKRSFNVKKYRWFNNPMTMIRKRLASIGPEFVYVLTVMGAGDIVSNATAGASYGYHLIWALGMTLVFRFVWVNASAK